MRNPNGVALTGRWLDWSVPNVSFVNFDSGSFAEFTELVLERHLPVVLFLIRDVSFDLFEGGFTDGEDPIAALPLESI